MKMAAVLAIHGKNKRLDLFIDDNLAELSSVIILGGNAWGLPREKTATAMKHFCLYFSFFRKQICAFLLHRKLEIVLSQHRLWCALCRRKTYIFSKSRQSCVSSFEMATFTPQTSVTLSLQWPVSQKRAPFPLPSTHIG